MKTILLQVFSINDTDVGPGVAKNFPMIKLINWFDIRKNENEAEASWHNLFKLLESDWAGELAESMPVSHYYLSSFSRTLPD